MALGGRADRRRRARHADEPADRLACRRAIPIAQFPWDAPQQTWRDLRLLASNLPLFRVALGIAFFYAIGALAQLNIDQLVDEGWRGAQSDSAKSPLLARADRRRLRRAACWPGIWSGDHVELGILPLGAFGVALNSLLLFTVPHAAV